jgi:hypothetical protein
MTPAEAAKQAAAQAAAWIAASPHLIDVLDWHQRLCGTCGPGRGCGEYREIIAEYGAGEHGAAVFWPEDLACAG